MIQQSFIGNQKINSFLFKSWHQQTLNHAYLLLGPQGIGKSTLVINFIKHLLCNKGEACGQCSNCLQIDNLQHPDVWLVQKMADKQDISIEQIRQLQEFINLGSLTGNWRIVIIDGAHYLNEESGNALLKSLEEPAKKVIFFLLSAEAKKILPTISSRCFILQLGLVPINQIYDFLISQGASTKQAKEISYMSGGRPGLALNLFNNPEILKHRINQALVFLKLLNRHVFIGAVKYLDNEFKESTSEPLSGRQQALQLITTWRIIERDLLFYKLGLNKYINHQALINELSMARHLTIRQLWQIGKLLQDAEVKLLSNSHIRLTLEWLAYSVNKQTT